MPSVSRAIWRGLAPVLPLILATLTLACRDESLGPPIAEPSTVYWDLHLDHHAVMLSTAAPYRTLPLVATPRNIRQEPLAGLPAPTYVSGDPERVLVTSHGELVAVAPTAPGTHVKVTATLTAGNLKHTDYVLVQVVDNPTPPVLGSLSVQPILPDSAKTAVPFIGGFLYKRLPLRVSDALGAPMTDVLVVFRSSDTVIATIDDTSGTIVGNVPGWVNLYAATTAFGVAKADTLRFRIGLPVISAFALRARPDGTPGSFLSDPAFSFNAPELRVGVGAVVYWEGHQGDARTVADITFTDPTHVAAFPTSPLYVHPASPFSLCEFYDFLRGPGFTDCTGSGSFVLQRAFVPNAIPEPGWQLGMAVRTFPVAGIYPFHSTLQGFAGRVIVVDEREE